MKDFYSRWYLHLHLCNTDWMHFILHSNASRGTVLHYQYYYFKCILFVCTKFMFIRKEFIAKTSHICICIFRIHRFTRHCHDHRISFQCSFVLVFVFYVHLRINIQDHFHLFVFFISNPTSTFTPMMVLIHRKLEKTNNNWSISNFRPIISRK